MLAEINQFIEKPDFNAGLSIFKKYGPNKALIFFFEQKIYGLDRLIAEVKKIKITEPQVAAKPKEIQLSKSKDKNSETPDVIKGLIDSKNIAWKEASDLHSRLMAEPDKHNRFKMALRITELSKTFRDCWQKLDQYYATGDYSFLVSQQPAENKLDLFKLFAERTLKQNYIIKAKKELNKIDNADKKQKKSTHLAKLETELQQINERLKFLNNYIIENGL